MRQRDCLVPLPLHKSARYAGVRSMKSLVQVIVYLMILVGLGYFSAVAFSKEWERQGDRGVAAAINQANHVFQSAGEYPANLAVSRSEIWGVLKGPSIRFRSQDGGCSAYYHQWPLGPHKGMNCESGDWWFEE